MKERQKNMNSNSTPQSNSLSSSINLNNQLSTNNMNDNIDNQNFLSPYNTSNFMAPQIGSIVRCTMCLNNTVQGKVLAYDQQTKMLALKTSINGKQNLWDVSLINVAWCSNLDIIEEPNEAPETLPTLNLQKLARRTKSNIETKNKAINALGNDVPTIAQHLYLTILKTLEEVEWDEKKIVVMNSVVIDPPYEINNCYSKKGDTRALEHVKKIVKKFHEDYKNQQQSEIRLNSLKITNNDDKNQLSNQENLFSANVSYNSFTSPSSPPPSSCSSISSNNNEK